MSAECIPANTNIQSVEFDYDLGILLPPTTNWERTKQRYGGLVSELAIRGVETAVINSHDSYVGAGQFSDALSPIAPRLGGIEAFTDAGTVRPRVLRDLTMPKTDMPLYADADRPVLVNDPSINTLLRSKGAVYGLMSGLQPYSITGVEQHDVAEAVAAMPGNIVVIKPDVGSASEGVFVGSKKQVLADYLAQNSSGLVIVQDAVDMTRGITAGGVETKGVHNARFIVIGHEAVFGFVRSDETGSATMQGETFNGRTFLPYEAFEEETVAVLHAAIATFKDVAHSHDSVTAFDLVKGIAHDGELRNYLLEINRKPLRNSPYDDTDVNTLWASHMWDRQEAAMLQAVVLRTKA